MGDQSEPALEKKKRAEILENAQHLSSDRRQVSGVSYGMLTNE